MQPELKHEEHHNKVQKHLHRRARSLDSYPPKALDILGTTDEGLQRHKALLMMGLTEEDFEVGQRCKFL